MDEQDLERLKAEHERTSKELNGLEASLNWEKAGKIRKQKETYETAINKEIELQEIRKQIEDVEKILITEKDPKLISLANEEKEKLLKKQGGLEKEVKEILKIINGDDQEANAAIIEIRAGAGGNEAALFAGDLFNMYSKYALSQGWQIELLNEHRAELGGFKEMVFQVSGPDCFLKMKYEGGVHRVQRIPSTEKSGRIHTSTASVAVLARPTKVQIDIKNDDLKIDTFKSSGPGGQNVNKRETAVRITHIPTGLVVSSQTQRNLLQNKENALSILRAKLLEQREIDQTEKSGEKRRKQIGQAKRAEKIRTYNFPQDRVTDHRIKKTWHNVQGIMAGGLNEMIEELERTLDNTPL